MTTLQLIEQELNSLRWTYEHVVKNNAQDYSKSYEHSLEALEAIKKQMISLEKDREILRMAHGGEVINA